MQDIKEMNIMLPANTEVTCPVCDDDISITKDMYDGDTITCDSCDAELVLRDGDLEEVEEDFFEDEDDEDSADYEEDIHERRVEAEKSPKFRK